MPRLPARRRSSRAKGSIAVPRRTNLSLAVLICVLAGIQPGLRASPDGDRQPIGVPGTGAVGRPPAERAESAGDREEQLCYEVAAYLDLRRTQVSRGLLLARQIQRNAAWQKRETLRQRLTEAEAGGEESAPAAEVLRMQLRQLEPALAVLKDEVAGVLVRLFTREQSVLAWRLLRGEPPKYAAVGQELARGGLSAYGTRRTVRYLLRNGDGVLALREMLGGLRDGVPTRAGTLDLVLDIRDPDLTTLSGEGGASSSKPFPQLAAETTNPDELKPGVMGLVEGIFLRPRLIPAFEGIIQRGEGPRAPRPRTVPYVSKLPVIRHYNFERGLRDITRRGPDVSPFGGTLQNGRYLFGPGQGLEISPVGVTDHYAIQMVFQSGPVASYQKLVDFKGLQEDGGLYLYQGAITFYTLASGGQPVPGRDHVLRLERDRDTRLVRAYLDFRPIFAFFDLDGEAEFMAGRGTFFMDDRATEGREQGPGALRSVMVWGGR